MIIDTRMPDAGREADLDACSREPIRTPGAIQPQGALLVVDPATLLVRQAAIGDGAAVAVGRADGQPLGAVLAPSLQGVVGALAKRGRINEPVYLGRFGSDIDGFHAVVHRSDETLMLELERAAAEEPGTFEELYPALGALLGGLQQARSVAELGRLAAREVRGITGFDRVLVYRFDDDWNGTVIAEDRNDVLPSYLDLRFPAADIPAQARELYRLNRLRLIADADYHAVPIVPQFDPVTGKPADLSLASLRSVSPVHLEYMRNMGTGASMSISILRDGELWGLISCHNQTPKRVPFHVRTACDFIGQVLSLQFGAREHAILADRRIELRAVQARLLARMAAAGHFIDGLVADAEDLMLLTGASGAAVVFGEGCHLLGETPSEAQVRQIADWLSGHRTDDVIATDSLATIMPGGTDLRQQAGGIMAISISQVHSSFVIWFRPEVVRTTSWGGSRVKPVDEVDGRIHPRKSFEVWKEAVRLKSRPWEHAEIEAAGQLRFAIVDIVLRQAEELAGMNEQLVRSNKELEAFSYSVSHDLRTPFRHIVGFAQLLRQSEAQALSDRGRRYIETIIESAIDAGTLVDDLLSFSQMGRATLNPMRVNMDALVAEVRSRFSADVVEREIEWCVAPLPDAFADPTMLRTVVQNLLDNAVKFTRTRTPAVIEVGAEPAENEVVYFVRDNGVGFDMAYVGKLFGVFQRLHRVEEFEGTGIGLANIKRIVEQRHCGRVWAEGKVGQGATVYFALPRGGSE